MVLTKILRQLSTELQTTPVGQSELLKYEQMRKTEGWKVYQSLVVTVANEMSKYLFTQQFTEQDAQTKDREQTAMFMAKAFFDFLLDPMKTAQQAMKFKIHNQRMEETLPANRPSRKAK